MIRDWLRSLSALLPFGCDCSDCSPVQPIYRHGTMDPKHPMVSFTVNDYSTLVVGRWDKDKQIAYVYRGDGTILQVYEKYRIRSIEVLAPDTIRTLVLQKSIGI